MVKLQQGDYVNYSDLTDEQYEKVVQVFIEAGACDKYVDAMSQRKWMSAFPKTAIGWDKDGDLHMCVRNEEDEGLTRKLTFRQVIGPQPGDAIPLSEITSKEMHEAILATASNQEPSFGRWDADTRGYTHIVYENKIGWQYCSSSYTFQAITPQDLLGNDWRSPTEDSDEFTAWGEDYPPAGTRCLWNDKKVYVVGVDTEGLCVVQFLDEGKFKFKFTIVTSPKTFAPLPVQDPECRDDDASKIEAWDYYQDLLRNRGYEGISDLLAKHRKLERRFEELLSKVYGGRK